MLVKRVGNPQEFNRIWNFQVETMVKNYYAEKARRKLMGNELWSIADNIAGEWIWEKER